MKAFKSSVFLVFFSVAVVCINRLRAQSQQNMTATGQTNLMVYDSVAQSAGFISRSQFFSAWSMALPYLPHPNNVTSLDIFDYPHFINTAVMVGGIQNITQMAMYFSQILYESNGLSLLKARSCSTFGNESLCANYTFNHVNNTGGFHNNATHNFTNYYGRGLLKIQNAHNYLSLSQALLNNSDSLWRAPDLLSQRPELAWAAAAWKWKTFVAPVLGASDAFGLSTNYLRPRDCPNGPSDNQTMAAQTAFNIYQQVLLAFSPASVPNPTGCFKTQS